MDLKEEVARLKVEVNDLRNQMDLYRSYLQVPEDVIKCSHCKYAKAHYFVSIKGHPDLHLCHLACKPRFAGGSWNWKLQTPLKVHYVYEHCMQGKEILEADVQLLDKE